MKSDNKAAPTVDTINAEDQTSGDTIRLTFSEPLTYRLATGAEVVGGADGTSTSAPAANSYISAQLAAKNYSLKVNGVSVAMPASGVAVFESDNLIRISVDGSLGHNLFAKGDSVELFFPSIINTSSKSIKSSSVTFNVP